MRTIDRKIDNLYVLARSKNLNLFIREQEIFIGGQMPPPVGYYTKEGQYGVQMQGNWYERAQQRIEWLAKQG